MRETVRRHGLKSARLSESREPLRKGIPARRHAVRAVRQFQAQAAPSAPPRVNCLTAGPDHQAKPALGRASRRSGHVRRRRVRCPPSALLCLRLRLAGRELFLVHDRLQGGNDIGGFGNRRRSLFDQTVGAFGARIERGTGYGENLAALLGGKSGSDQRARAFSPPRRRQRRAKVRKSADCAAENRARGVPSRTAFPSARRPQAGWRRAGPHVPADRRDHARRRVRQSFL